MSVTRTFAVPKLLYSATALAATANSGTVSVPQADSYAWILDVGTVTGTSPTLSVAIQISPDGGTTWYSPSVFTQATAAVKTMKISSNGPYIGQAAATTTITTDTTAVESNFPVTASMRILATVGGTNPSFATVKVWVIPIYASGRYQ